MPGSNATAWMTDLTSAAPPPVGEGDHVRGTGPQAIVYLDLGCPACAVVWPDLLAAELRLCIRHFPIASRRPRSPALHAAAEAASRQQPDGFWHFASSIYADLGHQDDPHLWRRAEQLELDLERFEHDRRSEEVAARIRADFESGIRAGVTGTPTAFAAAETLPEDLVRRLAAERNP